MSTARRRGRQIGFLALVAALAECRHGIFPLDEGTVLNAGHAVLTGRTLYQECHVNYGPGVPWLLAILFRLLGTDVIWARLFTVACFVGLVLVVRSMVASPLGDVAALSLVGMRALFYPYWVMVSYTPSALLLHLGALRAVLGRRYLLAGLLAGAAFACKQNIGGLAIMAMPMAAAVHAGTGPGPGIAAALRAALRVVAGSAVALGAMAAGLAATSSLGAYYQDAVVDNVNLGEFWRVPYPLLLPADELERRIFAYVPSRVFSLHFSHPELMKRIVAAGLLPWLSRLLFALPPLAMALALVRGLHRVVRHPRDERGGRLLALALGAAALLPAAWPSTTVIHFTTPMVGGVIAACVHAEGCRRRERLVIPLLLAIGGFGLVLTLLAWSWERSPVHFSTGTLVVDDASARRYRAVLDHLDRTLAPEAPILVVPYHPFYYFATGHPNPTSDDLLLPPWFAGARLDATVELVRRQDVAAVVWCRTEFPTIGSFASYAAPLVSAIEENYELSLRRQDQVWKPKRDPEAGAGR